MQLIVGNGRAVVVTIHVVSIIRMIIELCCFSVPVRSVFEGVGGDGCEVIAMSADAKYIAVLSSGTPQVSSIIILNYNIIYRY